LRDYRKEIFV